MVQSDTRAGAASHPRGVPGEKRGRERGAREREVDKGALVRGGGKCYGSGGMLDRSSLMIHEHHETLAS